MDTRQLEKAWKYHEAADQLLNGRIQSFLIAQAFLIVGYMQVITASSITDRIDLKMALFAISLLAIFLTLVMRALAGQLSRGIRALKKNYLLAENNDGDEVYRAYFSAVRGDGIDPTLDGFARGWTKIMPNSFLVFWLTGLAYSLFLIVEHIR